MKFFTRIALFALTNLLVMLTISFFVSIFGLGRYMTASGMNYPSLMVFCLIWGGAGSLVSLAMSRLSAKMMMGVQVIDPDRPGQFAWLVQTVHEAARRAGLPAMPEVGVYPSGDINAFATGPTQSRSLVAVSQGLLQHMDKEAIEGVIGHEVAHIKNGDMVTMTLIQGVVNAFVMFFARVISYALSQQAKQENRYMVNFMVRSLLEVVFGLLGMIVVAWFSRRREFRADAGSAKIFGRTPMLAGLRSLEQMYGRVRTSAPGSLAALQISDSGTRNWAALLSTHPPLAERIHALESGA